MSETNRTKWEYLVVDVGDTSADNVEGMLNDQGQSGWELIMSHRYTYHNEQGGQRLVSRYLFKRPT